MSFELTGAAPPAPPNLLPANGAVLPDATTTVTLSWGAVSGEGTYSVRVDNLTNPDLRHAGNNCPKNDRYVCRDGLTQTSLAITVKRGHTYAWSVRKGTGATASARFRVGESDAAEFVRQAVPEIVAPGGQATVTLTLRNAGSTTWTAAAGYKLGSQNPQDNATWGMNRVPMPAGARVVPGQNYTFSWMITAPPTPQVLHFQWRMIREGVQWFGQRSPDRFVHLKTRPDGGSLLKRDTATGLLLDPDLKVVTLRGGHYYLFEKNSQGERRLVYKDDDAAHSPPHYRKGETIFKEYVNVAPCPAARLPQSVAVKWPAWPAGGWTEFFGVLDANDINLVRVFLTNGSGILNEAELDVYPFKTVNQGGVLKWRVKLATSQPANPASWNDAYFARLKAFAHLAARHGVFLQLSLFNYYDLSDRAWGESFWNWERSDDSEWGKTHLVNPGTQFACADGGGAADEGRRYCYFIESTSAGLRAVQEQFARKVVRELAGQPNIILEVMNEPHRGTQAASARFASRVIGWVINEGEKLTPKWRPLISVNADRRGAGALDKDDFDVDWWAANQGVVPHYEDVDIVSFHGLTGYPDFSETNPCNPTVKASFPPVDLGSIRMRCDSFRRKQTGKALMMSTDAVRVLGYYHKYGVNRMDLMEGQITTNLNHGGSSRSVRLKRSDLEDWAYWCFAVGKERSTVIHFQQHSIFEAIYPRINAGFTAVPLSGAVMNEVVAEEAETESSAEADEPVQ